MEASGRLHSLATRAERTFHTDSRGRYTLADIPFGRYRLDVSKPGFLAQSVLMDVQSAVAVARTVKLELSQASTASVTVVATTPLAGIDLPPNEIAAPVQTLTHADMEKSGARDLSDLLNRRLSGVYLNEVQGNPFQADLNYRGYTASPLLGTPQGVSVYMDGVRLNQPFGDVVSWDLIPRIAIAEVTLMPGSNPLFGLNTLGGALSLQTKDGYGQPGTMLQLSGGSFGRRTAEFEHGGANSKGLSWYVAGNLYFEDGWRENSPSNVRQIFGKLGWQRTRTTFGLTVAYANNSLNGNGMQEQRFLARDYASVYTKPDITKNRSPLLNFSARRILTNNLTFFGNVYYRYIRTNTVNGDSNEGALDQPVYQPSAADRAALTAAGYTGFPTSGANAANTPFPFWRCIAQALQNDEPAEKCNGLINRTHAEQHNAGGAGQLAWFTSPRGYRNQFTGGFAYDRSSVNFLQSSQLGYLNPDHSITQVNAFGDGVTGGTVDGEPYDTRVNLHGLIQTGSLYATDTLSIGHAWTLTLSGRYNRTAVDNTDRIHPNGNAASLSGKDVYSRLNPAIGVTFNPIPQLNSYVGYTEGSRAPTSIEVGCADPSQPCKLPNAMAADPPLRQVIARTWEAGLRSGSESKLHWSAGWFRADNRNDILFVASEQTGFGYFRNFGKTRRQGVEADLRRQIHRLVLGGGYTFLDATYQSPETVKGSSNSTNDSSASGVKGVEGTIQIRPGGHIPLIPQHMLKAYGNLQATSKLSVDLGLVAFSSSYARGNEDNAHRADGTYYLGPGTSPGYAVLNLGARYRLRRRIELFAQVNNLADRHYYTAAQLGPTAFTSAGTFIARPFAPVDGLYPVQHATFYSPGAPRSVVGGVRLTF